jgi:hypothetical protein
MPSSQRLKTNPYMQGRNQTNMREDFLDYPLYEGKRWRTSTAPLGWLSANPYMQGTEPTAFGQAVD